MPWLINLIPDADAHCVLEPDELGLRMLPALASWSPLQSLSCPDFVRSVVNRGSSPVLPSQYPPQQGAEVEIAIREAWAWLEGAAS